MLVNKKKSHKRLWITLAVIAVVVLAAINCALVYVNDYYEANATAQAAISDDSDAVSMQLFSWGHYKGVVAEPQNENIRAGLIFYPGGKVEYFAYAPLMKELAENGILCILPHMPGNLAVFDIYMGQELMESYLSNYYPDVKEWYIGGHSLGGSMAAACIEKYPKRFEGLVLCASYSTKDLSQGEKKVISLYGSNDQVLKKESYEKNRINLPSDFTEFVIEGGNHAFFGCYGAQKGDGEAEITNAEQIHVTVDHIVNWIEE